MSLNIALINMPFGFHIYPSIQLGTLSTLLKSKGYPVKGYYLNLHFAHQLGMPVYNKLCEKRFLIGEWLFSHLLFGENPKNQDYLNHFDSYMEIVCQSIDRPREFLTDVKTKMVPEFLQWSVEAGNWGQYDVIGFSSTFNQNVASVTLAKLIKEKHPSVKIMFGGSNFESEMGLEYFRVFPWIDFVVPGEAEGVLVPLIESLENGGKPPKGVVYRKGGEIVFEDNHEMLNDFSENAVPDYDDFFEQLQQIDPYSPLLENPIILYETARGCWWGEKHHCTFCGLNANTMEFRSKPIEQVQADVAYLAQRYDSFRFRFVDNILELKYIEGIFGEMARNNFDLQFFIEVKSNLTKQQIKSLAHGGANVIQPGIESFSLNQLMAMDKGVRPLQNILCMKWAMYYGIEVNWNILIGFPGETNEDYRNQIDLIRLLFHLPPPECVGDLYLERFSPYFSRPEEYGVTIKAPGEAYSYVYDSPDIDLFKIAYDFEFTSENEIDPELRSELLHTAQEWKERHQSDDMPYLIFTKSMNFVTIYDDRTAGNTVKKRLEGPSAWTLLFCNESAKSMDQIKEHIRELGVEEESAAEKAVQQLEDMGILYGEKGKYLTLALPHNANL
ncbi:MAG: RiPP maturation radical SAM C-methyltransferase [Nitrospinaceae bacterium]|nr:RiPP maturation radical SAM C-methyltransferase [Nitrospinaceae bacterium]MDP7058809.1 RiPP maturation radical SAM C-methyltransferase [Nitrospinaceae bacterium]